MTEKRSWDRQVLDGNDPFDIVWWEIQENVTGMLREVAMERYLNNFIKMLNNGVDCEKAIEQYKDKMSRYFINGYNPAPLLRWFLQITENWVDISHGP